MLFRPVTNVTLDEPSTRERTKSLAHWGGPARNVSGRVILPGTGDIDRGTHHCNSRSNLVYSTIGPWQLKTGLGALHTNRSAAREVRKPNVA
jgi:hypothetical protein